MNKNFLNISLLLILILLLFLLALQNQLTNIEMLKFIIEVYGTFVATLLGVYISLGLTKKMDRENEEKSNRKTMLGNLKVIWSELDVNEDILKNLLEEGLKKMPRIAHQLYAQQSYLIKHAEGLKNKAFYSTMSSGAINIISEHNNIFNDLQIAYYNTELTQKGLVLSNETYRDLAVPGFALRNPDLVSSAFAILDGETAKVERTISLVKKAKKTVYDYLTANGTRFSREETLKQA